MNSAMVIPEFETVPIFAARRCAIMVGGVSLAISVEFPEGNILPPEHREFEAGPESCDIELRFRWVDQLPAMRSKKLFDSGAVWSLYSDSNQFIFDFASPVYSCTPYKRLLTDPTFSSADLLLNRRAVSSLEGSYLIEYPIDELLITNWLAQGRGVEIHGCGVLDAEAGAVLFVGHSGAGKSTTVSLWNALRNVHVLSDDRIILRNESGRVTMYGTPWHGDAGFASPRSAPARAIFILEHGDKNEITPLPPPRAVGELFARCFLPFHDPRQLQTALNFLHEMTALAPCYRYSFSPNASAVERILGFLRSR